MPTPIIAGSRIYMVCQDCERLVCLNKWIFGSLHICLTDEERMVKQGLKERKFKQTLT